VTGAALPQFETPRLLLQPRVLADTEACLAMDREPEMVRFIAEISELLRDPAAHRAFVEARTRGPYAPGLGYWTLRRREEPGGFLGWVLLIPINGEGPEVEIGWRLRRVAWGQGYAAEAAAALLSHGLGTLDLPESRSRLMIACDQTSRFCASLACSWMKAKRSSGLRPIRLSTSLEVSLASTRSPSA
jgi:RimJ/RimL family protein N-acetyltransferase